MDWFDRWPQMPLLTPQFSNALLPRALKVFASRPTVLFKSKVKVNLDKSAFKYQIHFLKRSDMATCSFTCKQALESIQPIEVCAMCLINKRRVPDPDKTARKSRKLLYILWRNFGWFDRNGNMIIIVRWTLQNARETVTSVSYIIRRVLGYLYQGL